MAAVLLLSTPERAATYSDPNEPTFAVDGLQDALDVAIIKCALGRPDCVGATNSSHGMVLVGTDGTNFSLTIQIPGGLPPMVAEKIPAKSMQRFQAQMALGNSLDPVANDPNDIRTSDCTVVHDPNTPNEAIRITSTLAMKVRTGDGRKGVLTVSVSPSFAVRWDLRLK